MSKLEKLRKQIEQGPKHVRFEDLDKLLRAYGFEVRRPGRGGSHYYYSKQAAPPCAAYLCATGPESD